MTNYEPRMDNDTKTPVGGQKIKAFKKYQEQTRPLAARLTEKRVRKNLKL